MEPDVFFLYSKRFWVGVLGAPAAWVLTWLAERNLDIMADIPPEAAASAAATVLVWLFSMWKGRRKVTMKPPPPPITEDQLREMVKAELAAMPVKARISDPNLDRLIRAARASRYT